MSIKATVIGARPPEAGGKPALAPTRLGEPPADRPQARPIEASALPGKRQRPLQIEPAQLARRFPGAQPALLERTHALLAGLSPQAMDAPACLRLGAPEQEELAALTRQRLALMEVSVTSGVARHLARLHGLLREVLDAMDGGLFKKPVAKVWASMAVEIRQIEGLLSQAVPALAGMLAELEALAGRLARAGGVLQAQALAAEYLQDVLDPDRGQLLAARQAALQASQALVLEQLQALALDRQRVQELVALVQDGVLLQLPSVHSQMAGLSSRQSSGYSDTQRFLATEKLAEIVGFIQRKL